MVEIGRITGIWRYPVKSMAGQRITTAEVGELGVHADRTWAVRDLAKDATTSAKRLAGLLLCSARYAQPPPPEAGPGHAPEVIIEFPDGTEISSSDPEVHAALSSYLDRDVELRPLPPIEDRDQYRGTMATPSDIHSYFGLDPDEPLPDLSMFPVKKLAELSRYITPVGSYVDAYPIHVITEQTLQAMAGLAPGSDFDVRRFRPTILVDAAGSSDSPETDWCGGTLVAPQAELKPLLPTVRCVMPSHAQYELARDRQITRTLAAHAHHCLGVYGTVGRPGRLREGDPLEFRPAHRSLISSTAGAGAAMVKRLLMKAGTAAISRGVQVGRR
ncbi:MOSC N-terminal beta barrel domain-containing protein [Mycobacterium sp. 1274756.6]|uniref:MOSC domain-containing protein n=1 Tax=Mycobacterium sp. 1274756.6 TaxID=1834076 RepID=UPI0007FE0A5A|nr:MOSC N-terminal beta barrel domain-containing protein [Mycobacterium sp. 1274756.6]OBJ72023.1 sulfurase [Mycobacterium sp. 1274756.6]